MNALELAKIFHNTYEDLAPKFGYQTREDTRTFDPNSNNGELMVAVCDKILEVIHQECFCVKNPILI